MTVIFLPDYTDGNPYQTNLANALDERVVIGSEATIFSILRAVHSIDDVSAVHFHWLNPYIFASTGPKTVVRILLTILQLFILRLQGISIVWTVHNIISHESKYPKVERWFKHLFIRLGFCRSIFVHCEGIKQYIAQEYNLPSELIHDRATVIPHGHYLDNYEDTISVENAKSKFGISQSETVFLYFGQIRPYKGVVDLINTITSLENHNIRLLVVGNPSNKSLETTILEKSAGDDRINTILEFIPDNKIQNYMNAADCVVLPYNEITTSGSAILAMSFGKAIIIPQLGCIPELLDEHGSLMYSVENENGLKTALEKAINRDLSSMGQCNHQIVQQYDWTEIAQTTSDIYSS